MELTEQMTRVLIVVVATMIISVVTIGILMNREMNGKKNNDYVLYTIMSIVVLSFLTFFTILGILSFSNANNPAEHPYTDAVKTVYTNNLGASVTYETNGEIYAGGKQVEKVGKSDKNHTLTATKGKAKLTKTVKYYQIIGDKTGTVDKIEYGKRTWTAKFFGFAMTTHTEPVVKIYFDEEEPENKKALEKLFEESKKGN